MHDSRHCTLKEPVHIIAKDKLAIAIKILNL